jgi:hypothetical protein
MFWQGDPWRYPSLVDDRLFKLSMRIYSPSSDAINGKWDPPAAQKVHYAFDWSPLANRPSIFSAYAGGFRGAETRNAESARANTCPIAVVPVISDSRQTAVQGQQSQSIRVPPALLRKG